MRRRSTIPDDAPTEPLEQMAEATLALCSADPAARSARVAYSGPLLGELSRPVRSLDDRELHHQDA